MLPWEALAVTEFEPDATTLRLLADEYQHVWIGPKLMRIGNLIRNQGGNEDDYRRWVLSSHLWTSYVYSTNDKVRKQDRNLEKAWDKAVRSKPFNTEDALSDLRDRIATHAGWTGRTGSRNRAVALAFVGFCIEHNCYTRTISSYELAKYTAGMSQKSVHRALMALLDLELLRDEQRPDRRTSARSTRRYRLNLRWGVSTRDSRNTVKDSLSQEFQPPHDLWSRGPSRKGGPAGLGPACQRVWEVLTDEPTTVREVSETTGMSRDSVRRYLKILADNCLAGVKPGGPGKPALYFGVDTPLDAVADMRGITGVVENRRNAISERQHNNQLAYPGTYWRAG